MTFSPQAVQLKDGTTVTIRLPLLEEAQQLVELKRSYIKHTTSIPMYLEEYPEDVHQERELIAEYAASPNSILLVAESNDNLIGNIDLTGSQRKKMFHTGMIGMGIKKEYRNQGLGKLLIQAVLDWAKHHSPLEIIWLDVYASNTLGRTLYQHTGFIESGTIPGFFKDANGYQSKVQMYMRIKK